MGTGAMTDRRRTAILLAACAAFFASGTMAQEDGTAERPATQTGKERLGPKASDPQRVNDCKVPPEVRGDSTRPDDCSHITTAPTTDRQAPTKDEDG